MGFNSGFKGLITVIAPEPLAEYTWLVFSYAD